MLLDAGLLIRQDPLKYGLGGKVWEAGSVFAKFLIWFLSHIPDQEVHILELGSGTGLAGISIAKYLIKSRLKWSITLTDTRAVLPLLVENISLNFPNDNRIRGQELVWGSDVKDWGINLSKINIVFGADVVYEEKCFSSLKETLDAIAGLNNNTIFFLAYVRRRRAEKKFWNMIKKRFIVQTVIDDPDRDLYCNSKLNIVRLLKKDQSYCNSMSPSTGASRSS